MSGSGAVGTVPLTPEARMRYTAGAVPVARHRALRDRLAADPALAEVMGRIVRRSTADIRAAHPNGARHDAIPNDAWRTAGYGEVADVNELLGLAGR